MVKISIQLFVLPDQLYPGRLWYHFEREEQAGFQTKLNRLFHSILSTFLPKCQNIPSNTRVVNLTQPRCLGHKKSMDDGISGQTDTRHL